MSTPRRRRLLALLAVATAGAGGGLRAAPVPVVAAGHLDAANVSATAAAIEITAQSAYSFVVNPDGQLPRASASIGADRALAVAGPADPGDDVDALPGTALPLATGTAIGQLQEGAGQAPPPLPTVFAQGVAAAGRVTTAINPITMLAGVPYEHVSAAYPDGVHGGQNGAAFGVDPSVADPSGTVAVDGALGRVTAGPGMAVADAGAGAATVATAVGLRIGRVSSHAEAHTADAVATSDAVSEVDDLDLLSANALGLPADVLPPPPVGQPAPPLLHVDAIRAVLHTERVAGAAQAAARTALSLGGVTVLGHAATFDATGLHVDGTGTGIQPVVDALNLLLTQVASVNALVPNGTPLGTHPAVPAGHIAGPLVSATTSHGGDEVAAVAAGLTLTVTTTALVPASTSVPPAVPPQLTPTPVTLSISLATARSSAYGRSFGASAPLPTVASAANAGSAPVSGAGVAPVVAAGGTVGSSPPAPTTPAPAAPAPLPAVTTAARGRPLPPALAVSVATLAELLLLGALVASYRRTLARAAAPALDPEALP